MGKKKERPVNVNRKPNHSFDANRDSKKSKKSGGKGWRSAATVRRMKMYNVKPKRDRKGRIVNHDLQSDKLPSTRIQPDPRWFGNTRVIDQNQLQFFRENLQSRLSSNYNVLLKGSKIPMSLLNDHKKGKSVATSSG